MVLVDARGEIVETTADTASFAVAGQLAERLADAPLAIRFYAAALERPDAPVAMLERLSGRTHQVLTSVAIHAERVAEQITQVSNVRFATLTPAQIRAYCATPEPYDKASGYGIQGLAALFVEHIEGSHSGIMGLPLFETGQLLRKAGYPL